MKRVSTGDRLKQIMDDRGLKQVDILEMSKPFQRELGITMSKSHLSQYVNDKSSPDQNKVYLLSKTLNVNEAWLMGYDVEMLRVPDEVRTDEDSVSMLSLYSKLTESRQRKVYNYADYLLDEQTRIEDDSSIYLVGQTAAGEPLEYGQLPPEQISVDVPKGADRALNVKGDSMEPLIKNGSIVFYKEQPDVENGQIAIVEIDGSEVTCKKVYKEKDRIILRSINKVYDDMEFTEGIRIIGKVII